MGEAIHQYIGDISKKACLLDYLDYLSISKFSPYSLPLLLKFFNKVYDYTHYENTIWECTVQHDLPLLFSRSFIDRSIELGGGLWKNGKINEGCYQRGESRAISDFKLWAENSGLRRDNVDF